jgi:hypothetical protein
MATTKRYRFEDCSCIDVTGANITIPAGVWPVLERDVVTIIAAHRMLNLPNAAFQLLKSEQKAVPLE